MKKITTLAIAVLFLFLITGINGCKKEDTNTSHNNNGTATCSDGIMNQNETGIDCGGVCAACTTAPSCSDGIQNQGETEVDCGGPCSSCSGYYINGLLNGVPFHISTNAGTYSGSHYWWPPSTMVNLKLDAGGVLAFSAYVGVYKDFYNASGFIDNSTYYQLYTPGTYGYYRYEKDSTSGGYIVVEDGNGVSWRSSYGDNTGSTFTITSRGTLGATYTTFKGNFSCKVYDTNNGNQKTCTGSFSSYGALQ